MQTPLIKSEQVSEQGHKTCRMCGASKSLERFSSRVGSLDGFRNECKDCRNKRQKEYSKTVQGKVVQHKADQKRNSKFVSERKARSKLYYMRKQNKIIQKPCAICGDKKSEAHHPDYTKPLDVIWLCYYHHKIVHNGGGLNVAACG